MRGPRAGGGVEPVPLARACRVLGELWLRGPVPGVVPLLRATPDLARHLPDPLDPDRAAAEHHRMTSLDLQPWASVFLDPEGMLGGTVTREASAWAREAGLDPTGGPAPDHLGVELRVLGRLSPHRARTFAHGHLLCWLPPFGAAVERAGSPLWTAVAGITLELVVAVADSATGTAPGTAATAEPGGVADAAARGPRELAEALASPLRSGLFLGRADLRELGRRHGVPRGFGGRVRMLETLLSSGVRYDAAPAILEGLASVADADRARHRSTLASHPGVAGCVEPWIRRLRRTGADLREVAAEARAGVGGP